MGFLVLLGLAALVLAGRGSSAPKAPTSSAPTSSPVSGGAFAGEDRQTIETLAARWR